MSIVSPRNDDPPAFSKDQVGQFAVRPGAIPERLLQVRLRPRREPSSYRARAVIEECVKSHLRQREETKPEFVARLVVELGVLNVCIDLIDIPPQLQSCDSKTHP